MLQSTENILIKQAKKGNEQALEELIGMYEQKIYSLALHLLKNSEEAYDASQDICIKIWRQIHTFEGQSKFSTWLYRIAVNQCLDIIRKNKNKNNEIYMFGEDEFDHFYTNLNMPLGSSIQEDIEINELKDVIKLGISELKEEHRIILVLRDMNDQSYEEISEELEISLGTVKSRLSRARQALRKILSQDKEPYITFFRHIK